MKERAQSVGTRADGIAISPLASLVVVARELQAPLILARQLSLQMGEECDDPRLSETARRLQLVTERAIRLADNVAKTARLEEGLFELEPLAIDGIFREVVDETTPFARALGQKILVDVARNLPAVICSRDLLKSLLVGLVDDGLQYNSPALPLEISARISRKSAHGFVKISVRDHGSAVSLREIRALDDNILRAIRPISARPLASGLGILAASEFLRKMNGELKIVRHRGGGLTLSALLPACEQLNLLDALP